MIIGNGLCVTVETTYYEDVGTGRRVIYEIGRHGPTFKTSIGIYVTVDDTGAVVEKDVQFYSPSGESNVALRLGVSISELRTIVEFAEKL